MASSGNISGPPGIASARAIRSCRRRWRATASRTTATSLRGERAAFARLDEQFGGLFHTADFIEGRKA